LKQGQDLDKFGKDLNVSVVVHSNPGDSQVLMASRDRNSEVRIIKGFMDLLFSTSTCTTMLTLYLLDSTVTSS
jgi:predicted nucleic acid-binding protein